MSKDIYDYEDWDIEGIPSEFVFKDVDEDSYFIEDDERWKETEIGSVMVSNHGRFFDYRTRHILKPTHGDDHGHLAIKSHINGKTKQGYAHRLIAKAFIDNPNNYPIVRHLNDDPNDNDISNLAWGTQKDNHNDSVENGTFRPFKNKDRQKSIEKMSCPVEIKNLYSEETLSFRSINEAARFIGAQEANLWKVLNGERKQTKGYSAKRITKEEYNGKTY